MCHLHWRHMCFFLIERTFLATCWPPLLSGHMLAPPAPPRNQGWWKCLAVKTWRFGSWLLQWLTPGNNIDPGGAGGRAAALTLRGASCSVRKRSEFGVANGRWLQPSSLRALLVYISYIYIYLIYIYSPHIIILYIDIYIILYNVVLYMAVELGSMSSSNVFNPWMFWRPIFRQVHMAVSSRLYII